MDVVEHELVVLLDSGFIASQSSVGERGRPDPSSSVVHCSISCRVHGCKGGVLGVPLCLGTFGVRCADNLYAIGICHTEIIGTDAHELAMLLVELQELVVAIEVAVSDGVMEFAESSKVRAWEAVEWVEEEAVGDQVGIEAKKVDREEHSIGLESETGGNRKIVGAGDSNDPQEEKVELNVSERVHVALLMLEEQEMRQNTNGEDEIGNERIVNG